MKKRYIKKKINYKKVLLLIIIILVAILMIVNANKKNNVKNQTELASNKNVIASDDTNNQNVSSDDNNKIVVDVDQNEVAKNNENATSIVSKTEKKLSSSGLPVLMYHFFYDDTKEKGNDDNWLAVSDFDSQMKYLSENNFYFPTWDEVEKYIDGKIELPEKSIVITIDDGDPSFFQLGLPVVKKYNIHVTDFVVTAWYGPSVTDYACNNVDFESHSHDMHKAGKDGKGVMLSWSDNEILQDLKKSEEILNEKATIFCYPFGQYNDNDEKILKQAGFKLSFTTKGGRVKKGANKYELPRVRIYRGMTLSSYKAVVSY